MALPYVSPAKMTEYRQELSRFAKSAGNLECIRSHFFPDRTGVCDLTGQKEQEEIFVLKNRSGDTIKVGSQGMQIAVNILDIVGADKWYQNLKEQRKAYRERLAQEAQKREEERKQASRTVLLRKKNPTTILKSSNS